MLWHRRPTPHGIAADRGCDMSRLRRGWWCAMHGHRRQPIRCAGMRGCCVEPTRMRQCRRGRNGARMRMEARAGRGVHGTGHRGDARASGGLEGGELALRHGLGHTVQTLRTLHRASRCHRGGMRVDVAAGGGVDVGDVGHMRHIHPLHVAVRHRIGRTIRLMRAKRNPAHSSGDAYAHRHTGCGPDEADQSRRIDRATSAILATPHRHPGPTVMPFNPAAIMERREPPGCVIHPGPAPRGDKRPMAVPIWCPARLDRRIPHAAIIRGIVPGAGADHRVVAGHLLHHGRRWRHVGHGHGRVVTIELGGQEFIAHFFDHHAGEGVIRTADLSRLMWPHRQADTGAGDGRRPFAHRDGRGGLRVTNDDFV